MGGNKKKGSKQNGAGGGGGNPPPVEQKEPTVPGAAICIRCPDPSEKNALHLIQNCKADVNSQSLWPGFSDGAQSFTSNKAGDCENFLKRVQNRSHDIQKEIGCTFDDLKAGRAELADKKQVVTKQDLSHAWSTWVAEKAKEKAPAQQEIPIRTAPAQLSSPPPQASQAQKAPQPQKASPQQARRPPQDTCKHCGRSGHSPQQCPYEKQDGRHYRQICSNCGGFHHFTDCKEGCQAPGCKEETKHYTWQHPDPASKLSEGDRAKIIGYGVNVANSADALPNPNPKSIYGPVKKRVVRPSTDYACYKGPTDNTYTPGSNRGTSVVTNYVKVDCKLKRIYVYSMTFKVSPPKVSKAGKHQSSTSPGLVEIKQRAERKRVFDALLNEAEFHGREDYATDFTTLWTGAPLDENQNVISKTDLQYCKQSGKQAAVDLVEIRETSVLNFSNNSQALSGQATEDHNPNELIRALNGMVTRCIVDGNSQDLFDVGTNMFFIRNSDKDIKGLCLQRGYYTSIRPGSDSALLNVNVTHGAFLKPMLVSEFIKEATRDRSALSEYKHATNLLKGRTVRIIYDREKRNDADMNEHRTKIISGFGDVPYLQQFEGEGKMWTVMEWFQSQGLAVKEETLPCVNVGLSSKGADGSSRALWILPEYLEIVPEQIFSKQLGPTHMELMHKTALQPPAVNQACIEEEGLQALGFREVRPPLADKLHLTAGENLLRIPATLLSPPVIVYGQTTVRVDKASWDLRNILFSRPTAMIRMPLTMIDLRGTDNGGSRYVPDPDQIANRWLKQCGIHGLLAIQNGPANRVEPILVSYPKNQNDPKYASKLAKLLKENMDKAPKSQTCAIILPPKNDSANSTLYAMVKRVAETQLGLHTICFMQEKLPNANDQYYSNVCLKQNLKAPGSQNHVVQSGNGKSAFVKIAQDTLVIGVDVVHPGGFHPSIAAMVGSIDGDFATFPGHVRLQPARQEILTQINMEDMASACINSFIEKRGQPPRRIVYFRDGVGEDQYQAVVEQELPELTRAYPSGKKSPEITAIIVGKRHNTRFFAPKDRDDMSYTQGKGRAPSHMKEHEVANTKPDFRGKKIFQGGPNGNIKPGLLVDSVITMPQTPGREGYKDFFLQSHAAIQGTAKSAHYVVVRNDPGSNLKQADIQDLCHAFCYNYARATKGVSYCSPAYYADRLCDRAHHYLRNYLAVTGRQWEKTEEETNGGKAGEADFRERVRSDIDGDTEWKAAGRANPWHPNMDKTMFWL
ncbi:Protein argonaute 18 [Pseudocercospora fuligena]|uniref:Protein argonaute 18 n=1 Tax=Pseudocercospora fuligena TaxID=685502 RepID=A0A8H6VIJ0_9PEZI|nr:Protein argonaute 18 [Pseudocercospora fuligena]